MAYGKLSDFLFLFPIYKEVICVINEIEDENNNSHYGKAEGDVKISSKLCIKS